MSWHFNIIISMIRYSFNFSVQKMYRYLYKKYNSILSTFLIFCVQFYSNNKELQVTLIIPYNQRQESELYLFL